MTRQFILLESTKLSLFYYLKEQVSKYFHIILNEPHKRTPKKFHFNR